MKRLEKIFPEMPEYIGSWYPVYFEPIIGSGEKITIAVAAIGKSGHHKVIQSLRNDLLNCLYGAKSEQIQSMIDWVIESLENKIVIDGVISDWNPPLDGIILGEKVNAADDDLDGILRQAIRFSSSLSTLALESENSDNEEQQSQKNINQWIDDIADHVKIKNPDLTSFFRQKVIFDNIKYSYGFLTTQYVANFGLLIPTRLTASINAIKAKIYDLETLKRSDQLSKPQIYEIIIGTPSLNDPTLSKKTITKLQDHIESVKKPAVFESIGVISFENTENAAEYLIKRAV